LIADRPVIKLYALMSVISFAMLVFCVVDIIGTPADRIRNLPKVAWLLLVLFFPLLGSIAWLAAGRPEKSERYEASRKQEPPAEPEE
jgi:hypothetical protein